MKELVVISGKGGTGKTSLVAAFAELANGQVLVDCDVDAPNLHIILQPEIDRTEAFVGGKIARIDHERCGGCAQCWEACRYGALQAGCRRAGHEGRTGARTGEGPRKFIRSNARQR